MTNKYIRHGETYCGDGTTSAAAASDGGVGAWNNINVFEGTAAAYGTALAAGDTVYIRSKDATGANITRTFTTANIGLAAASITSPVNWYIDPGVVWPEANGVITYTCNAGDYNNLTVRAFNNIFATNHNLVITTTRASYGEDSIAIFTSCTTRSIKIDLSLATAGWGGSIRFSGSGTHTDTWLRIYGRFLKAIDFPVNNSKVVLHNPTIELLNAANLHPIISMGSYGSDLLIIGGEVKGVGVTENICLVRTAGDASGSLKAFGLKFDRVLKLSTPSLLSSTGHSITANSCDGVLGNSYYDMWFSADSRDDGYYPRRFASLETSTAATWAYKLYPFNVNQSSPGQINLSSLYTQDDATKTITVEFLWPSRVGWFPTPNNTQVYLNITYVKSDGTTEFQTSHGDGSEVTPSSATWSATTYGPSSFTKRKIAITTSSAIKKDTEVFAVLSVAYKSLTVDDIVFVDPEIGFS